MSEGRAAAGNGHQQGSGHPLRPQAAEFTTDHMRACYAPLDLLGIDGELILPEATTLDEAINIIAQTAGLTLTGRDDDLLPAAL